MPAVYRSWSNILDRPMRKLFADFDPEGFIKGGAPVDEYNGEADKTSAGLLLRPPHDAQDVFCVIWPIFKHWMGYNEESPAKQRYMDLAITVFNALDIRQERIPIGEKHRLSRKRQKKEEAE